ncbi:MAG: hypothetical protein JW855_03880 [Gammaproteobacteria bacterium]|nr:hypothetical protein [Gammaproteobacteria bacterium]
MFYAKEKLAEHLRENFGENFYESLEDLLSRHEKEDKDVRSEKSRKAKRNTIYNSLLELFKNNKKFRRLWSKISERNIRKKLSAFKILKLLENDVLVSLLECGEKGTIGYRDIINQAEEFISFLDRAYGENVKDGVYAPRKNSDEDLEFFNYVYDFVLYLATWFKQTLKKGNSKRYGKRIALFLSCFQRFMESIGEKNGGDLPPIEYFEKICCKLKNAKIFSLTELLDAEETERIFSLLFDQLTADSGRTYESEFEDSEFFDSLKTILEEKHISPAEIVMEGYKPKDSIAKIFPVLLRREDFLDSLWRRMICNMIKTGDFSEEKSLAYTLLKNYFVDGFCQEIEDDLLKLSAKEIFDEQCKESEKAKELKAFLLISVSTRSALQALILENLDGPHAKYERLVNDRRNEKSLKEGIEEAIYEWNDSVVRCPFVCDMGEESGGWFSIKSKDIPEGIRIPKPATRYINPISNVWESELNKKASSSIDMDKVIDTETGQDELAKLITLCGFAFLSVDFETIKPCLLERIDGSLRSQLAGKTLTTKDIRKLERDISIHVNQLCKPYIADLSAVEGSSGFLEEGDLCYQFCELIWKTFFAAIFDKLKLENEFSKSLKKAGEEETNRKRSAEGSEIRGEHAFFRSEKETGKKRRTKGEETYASSYDSSLQK